MAAQQAVLHTYELVERIIAHLPMLKISNAKLVCKTWKAIGNRSQLVRRAQILTPSAVPHEMSLQSRKNGVVYYGRGIPPLGIQLHRVFRHGPFCWTTSRRSQVISGSSRPFGTLTGILELHGLQQRIGHLFGEYVTRPRCAALSLTIIPDFDSPNLQCDIYAPGGVTFRHVVETLTKLLKQYCYQEYGVDEDQEYFWEDFETRFWGARRRPRRVGLLKGSLARLELVWCIEPSVKTQ